MVGHRLTTFLDPITHKACVESPSYLTLGKGGISGFRQTPAPVLLLGPRLPPKTISAATARHQRHF